MFIKNAVWNWYVVSSYDSPYGKRNEILSRHTTYELARKALKRKAPGELGNWLKLENADDYEKS